ncbi:hypothetical protein B0H10DRAFT_2217537 [Mycena sp. CBHHK59/15]|nr:hypothetical protein B0H10DRAFT_2217537 [Mycena sp. CBHHK59/15]
MSASGGQPSSGTSSAEDLDTSWQKDAHLIGQATCPSALIEAVQSVNSSSRSPRNSARASGSRPRLDRPSKTFLMKTRFVRAIGSGKVENVDRLVRVQLDRKQGIRGLLTTYDKAVEGVYHTKSYTEQDDCAVCYSGSLLGIGLPISLIGRWDSRAPKASEVAEKLVLVSKIATEKRIWWDPKTNNFLGVCREHGKTVGLQFNNERDLEELFRAKEEDKIHFAGEATVAALGILSDERRLYSARPVLISADSGTDRPPNYLARIRRRKRHGKAFVEKTFTHSLKPESDIYDELKDLLFMDFQVGEDDLTADKDPKHVFKRGRNRLLRMLGMKVFGVQITPAIIRAHLQHAGHSSQHINADLCPDDKQDVKQAYKLLKDIWSLPPAPEGSSPGFTSARHALRIIGSLFYHLLFPYICVDLTLSEQLEHLSAAAHLNLLLYRDGQKDALPTLLFTDIMIMIKNVYFSVAKAKKDDPRAGSG